MSKINKTGISILFMTIFLNTLISSTGGVTLGKEGVYSSVILLVFAIGIMLFVIE
jgi:hypothetical protein